MAHLAELTDSITPVDRSLEPAIQAHLDDLTKPQGSLGKLESIAMQYALARGTAEPTMGRKRIIVFAADHGVADEGVSAFPKEVTPQMVMNMLAGGAAINVLSKHAGADTVVIDIGVASDFSSAGELCQRKVRAGTSNMTAGPAMSTEEAMAALSTGYELAQQAAADGVTLLGFGEMGIANSTAASAICAALLPCPVEDITGRGTGIDDDRLRIKIDVIKRALETNADSLSDPLSCLAAIGGFEIAGICGAVLGACASGIPVVIDGFISSAGALVALRMKQTVADYLFFSHMSAEKGHRAFMEGIDAEPILDLGMRLGEGTGSALAMMIIEASLKVYNEMATFSSAGVSGKED